MEAIEFKSKEFFRSESKNLHELFDHIQLSTEILSKAGRITLDHFAQLAATLHLVHDYEPSSYCREIYNLIREYEANEEMNERDEMILEQTREGTKSVLQDLEKLQLVEKRFQSIHTQDENELSSQFMRQKIQQNEQKQKFYDLEIDRLQKQLDTKSIEGLQHHNIVQLAKEVENMKLLNKDLDKELEQYHNLPLDAQLVDEEIQCMQQKVLSLQTEFENQCSELY